MLYQNTLTEIASNINTGIEYEIALFYQLLFIRPDEQKKVMSAIERRKDAAKVKEIISNTDTTQIQWWLMSKQYGILIDASFETQNDSVGPSDIVLYAEDKGNISKVGISVKFANTCTMNVTGRKFITESQIDLLKQELPHYTDLYIQEMTRTYGDVDNWFRKRKPSSVTDQYIDLVRDAVIQNWKKVNDKATLLSALFHIDSPIDFWVVTYDRSGIPHLEKPQTIDLSHARSVWVDKLETSYVAFYLGRHRVAHMQVKFNNGFVEKCKKKNPDVVWQGVEMAYGQPFSSWNFCVEHWMK